MKNAYALVTDSGGVQEEGPSLGKPVLVLRDETERPEAVQAGTVQLVGWRREAIVRAVSDLWERPEVYARFARALNPYGDGRAADRIAAVLRERYGLRCGEADSPIPPWPPVGPGDAQPGRLIGTSLSRPALQALREDRGTADDRGPSDDILVRRWPGAPDPRANPEPPAVLPMRLRPLPGRGSESGLRSEASGAWGSRRSRWAATPRISGPWCASWPGGFANWGSTCSAATATRPTSSVCWRRGGRACP